MGPSQKEPEPGTELDSPEIGLEDAPPDLAVRDALVAQARLPALAQQPMRFRDIDDRRLVNPSAMLPKPGWWVRFWSHQLFRKISFEERHIASLKQAERDGSVVLAMNHHSLLDYLYFNYAYRRHSLPLVFFANTISLTFCLPLWRLIAKGIGRLLGRKRQKLTETELLTYGLERDLPALIFMKKRGFWPWAQSGDSAKPFLRALVRAQRERVRATAGQPNARPKPILVVPQLLVWTQDPDRYGTSRLRQLVFGNPDAPGRLRKVVNFLLNRKRAFVQLGKTVNVLDLITSEPDLSLESQARRLGFMIHQSFRNEDRVIRGPILKGSKRIRQEIVRTRHMQEAIGELARELNKAPGQVEADVSRYLKEIAADFAMSYLEFMCMAVTLVVERIYDEVVPDMEGLERIREAGRKGPVMVLPCHRSHIDYLVVSYLFYANGLISPHIAAGANLRFFPMGYIFKRSGAFFLRRSFKGNKTYALSFREYLRKLIKEGYWIEFFIEGGRSRTGKMLPPRFGLLRQVVEAIKSGAAPDVWFAPIYLGYEHIVEERAYTRELSGGDKIAENITGLLRTTRVLWSRYGRLYVNFAEPFSCRELLEAEGVMDIPDDDPKHSYFVRRLAYRVLSGINHVAMVTPSAATAMALLTHPRRGIHRSDLLGRVGFILEMAVLKRAPLSKTLEHALRLNRQDVAAAADEMLASGTREQALAMGGRSPLARARGKAVLESIDEAITRFISKKQITQHNYDDEVVYRVVPQRRLGLDFYKNNIVHLFVKEAILAATVLANLNEIGCAPLDVVRTEASFLSGLLKLEFVYNPDRSFEEQFERTLNHFISRGLLERVPLVKDGESTEALRVTEMGGETMMLCHRVLEPWLESYWVLVVELDERLSEPEVEKEFVKRLQKRAQRRYQEGELSCMEASNSVSFKHALERFTEWRLIKRYRKGRDAMISLDEKGAANSQEFRTLAARIRRHFCAQ